MRFLLVRDVQLFFIDTYPLFDATIEEKKRFLTENL
jgi:hypothetical protein